MQCIAGNSNIQYPRWPRYWWQQLCRSYASTSLVLPFGHKNCRYIKTNPAVGKTIINRGCFRPVFFLFMYYSCPFLILSCPWELHRFSWFILCSLYCFTWTWIYQRFYKTYVTVDSVGYFCQHSAMWPLQVQVRLMCLLY